MQKYHRYEGPGDMSMRHVCMLSPGPLHSTSGTSIQRGVHSIKHLHSPDFFLTLDEINHEGWYGTVRSIHLTWARTVDVESADVFRPPLESAVAVGAMCG